MAKYRFVSTGDMTIGLVPDRKESITDAAGGVIGTRKIPPIQAVFNNGYFETDNDTIAKLLQEHPQHWGNDVFWHPTCLPKKDGVEDKDAKAKSKTISESVRTRTKTRHRQALAAAEGNIPVD